MLIHNTEHTFYYIDPSKSDSGDGSSVASAATSFPSSLNTDNVIYLVRRTSVDTPANFTQVSSNTTYATPVSVVFMGMPKAEDPLFSQMPEDAKTAWIDQEQEYAFVKNPTTGSYYINFTGCTNFHMSRICWMSTRTNTTWEVYFQNSSYGTNANIDHCWFRYINDFTVAGTSRPDYRAGSHYFHINGGLSYSGNSIRITNTRIDKWGRESGIWLGDSRNMYIDNCEFNIAQSSGTSHSCISWQWDNRYRYGVDLTATNLTAHYYFSNADERYMHSIIRGYVRKAKVSNVTIDMGEVQNYDCYQTYYCSFTDGCISLRTMSAGITVQNVTATIPTLGTRDRIIYIQRINDNISVDWYSRPLLGEYITVRNIDITAQQTYTQQPYRYQSEWYENPVNYSDYGLISLRTSAEYRQQAGADYILQNISVNAPLGYALKVAAGILDLEDCDISGAACLAHVVGKIKSISSWYPGYALCIGRNNTLYVGKISCNKQNPKWSYNQQFAVQGEYAASYILVGESNIRCYSPNYSGTFNLNSSYLYDCMYICSNDRAEGAYFARNFKSKAETWSSYRQGSASMCSIKLTNETADDRYWPITIGCDPFKGITQTVTAGEHTLTMYLALTGYNDSSQIVHRFFVDIALPDGEHIYSQSGNWELDETSVWNNLSGYTAYKLTIPFKMETAGEISTSFRWSWYMQEAATFVDPFPTIDADNSDSL